jgi:hypothetical protein
MREPVRTDPRFAAFPEESAMKSDPHDPLAWGCDSSVPVACV